MPRNQQSHPFSSTFVGIKPWLNAADQSGAGEHGSRSGVLLLHYVLSDTQTYMWAMKTLPKKEGRNWSKIGIIVLGIGFALLFTGTYLLSILTGSVFIPAVKAGDSVTMDLTIRDYLDRPVLTTDQQLYSSTIRSGEPVFFAQRMTIPANSTVNETFVGISAYYPSSTGGWVTFGLLGPELELISSQLVGMHAGQTKTIDLSTLFSASSVLSKNEYEQLGGNYTQATIGQMYPWQFADQPSIDLDPSNPSNRYYRVVEIIDKSEENITLSYLYSSAEVTVVSTNTR
jgi:hypothetical protein